MIRRVVDDRDVIACLETHPARIGIGLIGRERAIDAWKTLIRSIAVGTALVESGGPVQGRRILGFGAGVFVARGFAEEEISHPRPGLNDRIIAGVDAGLPVVLDDAALRAANRKGGGGLDLVILYASVQSGLPVEQMLEVHRLLASAFFEHHVGYRVREMLTEVIGELEQQFFEATHVWRAIARFDDSGARRLSTGWGPGRVIALTTRDDALAVVGSVAASVFQYQEPVLRLSYVEQQLLTAALDNLTDEELSERLQLSMSAIKKRWVSVFAGVAKIRPDLFLDLGEVADDRRRGRQRRHHLLAYVRSHPEELRPIHPRWLR